MQSGVPQKSTDEYAYAFQPSAQSWYIGNLTINAESNGAGGCERELSIAINGALPSATTFWPYGTSMSRHLVTERERAGGSVDSVQIGQVSIQEVQDSSVCGADPESACNLSSKQIDECPKPDEQSLRTFYDPATRTQQLYASNNVRIATDEPKSFLYDDKARLARG
jgi:hypothetical protein